MKKILVISWFFPPVNSSEGIVTYKLLNNSKYNYDIFTQKGNSSWSYGNKDVLPLNNNINCLFSDATNLDDFINSAYEFFVNNSNKYDIVMTRSMPEESHIIGMKIKKFKPDIKWIASFGDPIGNNPFTLLALKNVNPYSLKKRYEVKMSLKSVLSPLRIYRSFRYNIRNKKQYNMYIKSKNYLEKKIVNTCDYIICNNSYQVDYISKNNNIDKSKFIILPHSYDKKLYANVKKNNDKIIFRYIGHLDDIRTPKLFLEAINLLNTKYDDFKDKVQFEFYGNMSINDKVYILDNELTDVVKIRKPINYLKSLEVMKSSDWLIHIDANLFNIMDKNVFFAAKLADYIGSGSNIFSITMLDGASADILRGMNAVITTYSLNDIANYLYLIVYNNYNVKLNTEYSKNFDAINVANDFDNFVKNEVLNED